MKPFDLERALAGDPVVTRDGSEVDEIFFSEKAGVPQPVIAHIKGNRTFFSFCEDGRFQEERIGISKYDLFMAPKITSRWINIYKGNSGIIYAGSKLHESQELAINHAKMECPYLVKTIFVEIEE